MDRLLPGPDVAGAQDRHGSRGIRHPADRGMGDDTSAVRVNLAVVFHPDPRDLHCIDHHDPGPVIGLIDRYVVYGLPIGLAACAVSCFLHLIGIGLIDMLLLDDLGVRTRHDAVTPGTDVPVIRNFRAGQRSPGYQEDLLAFVLLTQPMVVFGGASGSSVTIVAVRPDASFASVSAHKSGFDFCRVGLIENLYLYQ